MPRNFDQVQFDAWMSRVNGHILRRTGGLFDADCLPDFDYATDYERGFPPSHTARAALRAAGAPSVLLADAPATAEPCPPNCACALCWSDGIGAAAV